MFSSVKARVLLLVGLLLVCIAVPAQNVLALMDSGDVDVSATVPGPPPTNPPTISQPTNGQVFEQKNITVGGTCDPGLIVRVFSNSIFVGSAVCGAGGNYSFAIDLFLEQNDLVARQYDFLNQPSPDSTMVTVYYVPPTVTPAKPGEPAPSEEEPVANFQLVIDYDYTAQGVFAKQSFKLPISFLGGTGPYTVTVDWGDGSSSSYQRNDTTKFTTEYTYAKPGIYTIVMKVSDSSGQNAYLQFALVVYGRTESPIAIALAGVTHSPLAFVLIVGPFVVGLLLGALIAFILAKRRRKKEEEKAQEL
jgi:hypothetical protein